MTDPRDGPQFEYRGPINALRRAWEAHFEPPCIVAPRSRLLYFPIPKAGSSTIIRALAEHEGVAPEWSAFEIVRPKDPRAEFPNFTAFTVVRNPWARLASCYRDKIVGVMDGHEGGRVELYNGFQRYKQMFGFDLFWLDMEFDQFVRRVYWIPDFGADNHIRSQYRRFMRPGGFCLVDRTFQIENTRRIERFLHWHNVLQSGQRLHRERRTEGPPWWSLYNERTARMVGQRYARDAVMFNYPSPFDARNEAHELAMEQE